MNFINVVIGGIEDQVGALIFGWWGESFINLLNAPFGFHFVNSWKTNQPIFSFVFTEGIKVINPVIFSNIFAFFGIFLTVVLSFILFRALKFAWFLSLVLALIFAFSPYVFMHIGIHPALSQIWLIPLFFQRVIFQRRHLLQGVSFANSIVTGFILAVAVLISNYLGFFLLLFAFCFFISDLICKRIFNCPFQFVAFLRYYLIILVSFVLLVTPFLFPYIKANYFSGSNISANVVSLSPQRTLEDFQNFSARPWYYILPPLANPVLGKTITRPVLDWMENSWGYFLADDYFTKEHGGDFLGWFNLTLFLIAITFAIKDIVKNVKCQMSNVKSYKISSLCEVKAQNHKSFYSEDFLKLVLTLALTIVLLFLFTMPPFFTVGGHKIYTLGFVLYKFFPMFRVTARLGVVILMGVLVINGVFLQSLFLKSQNSNVKCQKLQNKFASRSHISNVKTFILFLYLIGSLFEFYVPVSTFDTSKV
ncbi:hypothetical protein KJ678_03565, partial [Patescibacteria group bacterium]|nr:hypothetical protein [Patescibacteria group bacterium]